MTKVYFLSTYVYCRFSVSKWESNKYSCSKRRRRLQPLREWMAHFIARLITLQGRSRSHNVYVKHISRSANKLNRAGRLKRKGNGWSQQTTWISFVCLNKEWLFWTNRSRLFCIALVLLYPRRTALQSSILIQTTHGLSIHMPRHKKHYMSEYKVCLLLRECTDLKENQFSLSRWLKIKHFFYNLFEKENVA